MRTAVLSLGLCLLLLALDVPNGRADVPTGAAADLPPLHIQKLSLRDPLGRQVLLRGVNLSHRSKKEPYWDWISEDQVDRIRQWGLNCVRLLLHWDGLEPTPGAMNGAYLAKMEQILGWCDARGLYVVLDMHQDLYGKALGGNGAPPWATMNDPAQAIAPVSPWWLNYFAPNVTHSFDQFWSSADLRAHYKAAWLAAVAHAKHHPSVVGYDLFNEPHFGSAFPTVFESGTLSNFYDDLIGAIRHEDPAHICFFEPVPSTVNQGAPTWLRKPAHAGVAYAPHYYDPITGFGGGYDGQRWRAEVAFLVMKAQAVRFGVPLYLGEWGVMQDVPNADAYNRDELALIERHVVAASTYWNYNPDAGQPGWGDTMSVVKPGGAEWPVVRRLAQPYPKFTAGSLSSYGFNPATRKFTMRFGEPAHALPAPTVLHMDAARHYPEGFVVECSDPAGLWSWTWHADRKELHVTATHARAWHEVRIRPAP
ncbi:MAG: cellulase family glycosylhydrolase [Planctomycetes bacterium]|nr:cellulase family glycosylhydrolase [Planctomycetota bacterium]